MKYLLVVAVLLVAWLVWRSGRTRSEDRSAAAPPPAPPPVALPQDMVRCPVCSLHLPRPDALPGASGRFYCSPEHRAAGGN
jgi:uncharacterized protein